LILNISFEKMAAETKVDNPLLWVDYLDQRHKMALLLRIGHSIGMQNYLNDNPCSFIGTNYFIDGARQSADDLILHLREPDSAAVQHVVGNELKNYDENKKNFDPEIKFEGNKVPKDASDTEFKTYLLAASYRLCGNLYYHEYMKRNPAPCIGPDTFKRAFVDEFHMIMEIIGDPVKNRRHLVNVINDVYK